MKTPVLLTTAALAGCTALLCSRAVLASLGGDVTSVETDRVHMKAAKVTQQTSALYTIHEMQTPAGTTVREFANADGIVFAVAWNGPFQPDLRQALGSYFEAYKAAPRARRYGHTHDIVQEPGLVVHSAGHMRSFAGIAYVPQLIPAGMPLSQVGEAAR
jgi:hypothetical protein